MQIELIKIKRTDSRLLENMKVHYSQPKGFVGRNICYAVMCDSKYYGGIVGGSSCLHLPGRDEFFGGRDLNRIINNLFYHVEGPYPVRNFTIKVIDLFKNMVRKDWIEKYGDDPLGIETLVELPRTGEIYKRAGFIEVGMTHGYTCKRTSGQGGDNWTGKRVWDTKNLRPKRVFCYKYE